MKARYFIHKDGLYEFNIQLIINKKWYYFLFDNQTWNYCNKASSNFLSDENTEYTHVSNFREVPAKYLKINGVPLYEE